MKAADLKTAEGFLFTDQYHLTMAQLYYRMNLHEKTVRFDHFFRDYPDYGEHQAGYCVNAGLADLMNWMQETHVTEGDIAHLRGQTGRSGRPLFEEDFLKWLRANGSFEGVSLMAIPEGRVVHPFVPLTIVKGPLALGQILETPLLNHLNYPTLIATKAARIRESGRGQLLLEFGLRRAQGRGAAIATRAALIGGADYSSYVGASNLLGLPPKGTHAHSMVQVFMALGEGELDAFRAYADVYPDDCLLLVDTINTLESGLPNAIKVFEDLRRKGHEPVGIRLDSGDLAYLSIQAARMLDQSGFPDTVIVLSNNLDELVIWQILTQITNEASRYGMDPDELIARLAFGVGTRLITSWGEPALGGVYKLVAVRDEGEWRPAIKISETPEKVPNPGNKRAWRLYDQRGKATADLLCLEGEEPASMDRLTLHHPYDPGRQRGLARNELSDLEPLLIEVVREGRPVYDPPTLEAMREIRRTDIERLDPGVLRLVNPHVYHVSLSEGLWRLKQDLIRQARGSDD